MEPLGLRAARQGQAPPQGLQFGQRLLQEDWPGQRLQPGRAGWPTPRLILLAQRRQNHQSPRLEFEPQAPGGQIFQSPLDCAPLPALTEFTRQPLPTPVRVGRQGVAHPVQFRRANAAALADKIAFHAGVVAKGRKVVPNQMKLFSVFRSASKTPNPIANQNATLPFTFQSSRTRECARSTTALTGIDLRAGAPAMRSPR